jgi:uncharacterized membrane protein YccC
MEYAGLFAVMGTWIVWLQYRNYKLRKALTSVVTMMRRVIDQEVTMRRTEDGFEMVVKKPNV